MTNLLAGRATEEATRAYAAAHAVDTGAGHFSEFLKTRLRLSSIGIGTFPGAVTDQVDAAMASIVTRALCSGINVIDTAAHYRYGHSLLAVGMGIREAVKRGVSREAMFLVSKGGFITFPSGRPPDFDAWFAAEIVDKKLGSRQDVAKNVHLLSPAYIRHQLTLSRVAMGVETLDAFLIDQPEVHIPEIGKEALNRKLLRVFVELETAVAAGQLGCYGISTFDGFRVETDHVLFQSLTSLLGLAEKAAIDATGQANARHHFRIIQLPFNQAMTEGFTRFSHATGQDNIASTLQAAYQLNVYVMASHTLMKGRLAQQSLDVVQKTLPNLANHAQRAIQFNRSTPGIGTTLVGISTPEHLHDVLEVAKISPLTKEMYIKMYQKTG